MDDYFIYCFKTVDDCDFTLIYEKKHPSSHKTYFMKDHKNQIWEESRYKGNAVFGGKDYFELVAEMNLPPSKLKTNARLQGLNLYNGKTRLLTKIDGKMTPREIKFPSLYRDDEKKWINLKPELCSSNKATEYLYDSNCDCECDDCTSP